MKEERSYILGKKIKEIECDGHVLLIQMSILRDAATCFFVLKKLCFILFYFKLVFFIFQIVYEE